MIENPEHAGMNRRKGQATTAGDSTVGEPQHNKPVRERSTKGREDRMIRLLRGRIARKKDSCHIMSMSGYVGEPQNAADEVAAIGKRLASAGEYWGDTANAVVFVVDDNAPPWLSAIGIAEVAGQDEWPPATLLLAIGKEQTAICLETTRTNGWEAGTRIPYQAREEWKPEETPTEAAAGSRK